MRMVESMRQRILVLFPDEWDRAAQITSPAYEHAPVTHAQNGSGPNGSGPPGSGPPGSDAADRDQVEPTETKTH